MESDKLVKPAIILTAIGIIGMLLPEPVGPSSIFNQKQLDTIGKLSPIFPISAIIGGGILVFITVFNSKK